MTTKLTLTIEKDVIEKAKRYAKGTQRSLSEMVQKYFEGLTEKSVNDDEISPEIRKIAGRLKLPEGYTDADLERDRREYLEKKHLK